jgi:phenylalanyl-tRNA synthetase beta chain
LQPLKVEGEAAYAEVDLAPLVEASMPRQFAGVNRFPTITRDLAVLVPRDVTWQALREAARSGVAQFGVAASEVEFVGDYYGKELPAGHKGVTLRLTLANSDRTLTEAEAADMEAAVMAR